MSSPRNCLFGVFWQDATGDTGQGIGVSGAPATGGLGEAMGGGASVGAGGTTSMGGGVDGGIGSVGPAGGAPSTGTSAPAFGGVSVAGVNAPGPSSAAPGGGQAAPGIGAQGGVSTAAATSPGGAPAGGGHGGIATGLGALFGTPQGTSPAIANPMIEAAQVNTQGLANLGQLSGLLSQLVRAHGGAPQGTPATTESPALSPDVVTQLNQAIAKLRGQSGGQGGIAMGGPESGTGVPGDLGRLRGGVATAPSAAAPAKAAAPTLGLGTPATFGTQSQAPAAPPNPFAPSVSPNLSDLATAFMGGGGNKVPVNQPFGVANGNFGASPWTMG